MYSYAFFRCIDHPTHNLLNQRGTTISLIDKILFTNDTDHKVISDNLITDISDHFPYFVSVQRPSLSKCINKHIRQFKPVKTTALMLIGILLILKITQKLCILTLLTKQPSLLNIHCPMK